MAYLVDIRDGYLDGHYAERVCDEMAPAMEPIHACVFPRHERGARINSVTSLFLSDYAGRYHDHDPGLRCSQLSVC